MSNRKTERAAALLENGVQRIREGQFVQARLLCEQVLQLAPRDPDALHLLGVIALHHGEHAAAVERLQEAVAVRPDDAAFLINLAYGYVGLKRLPEALAAFERAAKLEPDDPELQLGIGNCLAMQKKPREAEAALRRLVERQPRYALGWFNLANALKDQERHPEAIEAYARSVQLAPRLSEAHCNLGVSLHKLGRYEEAEQAYRACLAIDPAFAQAYISLAIALNRLRRHEEAETLCREALARGPGQKNAWPILGKALAGQRRWREALQCQERAVREFSGNADALEDLGNALRNVGKTRDALDAFDRALELGNVSPFMRFSRALTLFSIGRIAEGAVDHLGRNERVTFPDRYPDRPLATALPPDLAGRTVCLIGEQGLGDEIFFLRYAAPLRARGCRIRYFGSSKLTTILSRCAMLDEVLASTEPFVAADHNVLIGDLPLLLQQTEMSPYRPAADERGAVSGAASSFPACYGVYWPEVPPPLPLQPRADRVQAFAERLRSLGPPPYYGLTWRAGTGPQDQRGRVQFLYKEAPREGLAQILRSTGGTLVALQLRPQPGEIEQWQALIGQPLHDFTPANEDLEDMLALLSVIDDYIGVSSTNMHLRACIGRSGRVLLPWPPDWRWMFAGSGSPWSPGFRVYRQGLAGGWERALAALREDLRSNPRAQ